MAGFGRPSVKDRPARIFEASAEGGGTIVADCRGCGDDSFGWVCQVGTNRTITHTFSVEKQPSNWLPPVEDDQHEFDEDSWSYEPSATGFLRWVADGSAGDDGFQLNIISSGGAPVFHSTNHSELRASGNVPAVTAYEQQTITVNVQQMFTYSHHNTLRFTVAEVGNGPGTVTISMDGSVLSFSGTADGTITLRITATAPHGVTATADLPITVQNAPTLESTGINPNIGLEQSSSTTVTLDPFFRGGIPGVRSYAVAGVSTNRRSTTATIDGNVLTVNSGAADVPVGQSVRYRVTATSGVQTATFDFYVRVGISAHLRITSPPLPTLRFANINDSPVTIDIADYITVSGGITPDYRYHGERAVSHAGVVTVDAQGGTEYRITPASPGSAILDFSVREAGGNDHILNLPLHVLVVNRPPEILTALPTWTWDGHTDRQRLDLEFYFRDPDGQPMTFTARRSDGIQQSPYLGIVTILNDRYLDAFQDRHTQPGTYTWEITAEDSGGDTVSQTYTIVHT